MSPASSPPKADPVLDIQEQVKQLLNREDFLNQAGVLQEEEKEIPGLGTVLLSEVTAEVRADLIGQQATGMMADQKKFDRKGYERTLIQAGVMDPSSPKGGRTPMFRPGDMDRVMKLGGAKIAEIVDGIEKLSSLGAYTGAAEGNSGTTQNGAGTSS